MKILLGVAGGIAAYKALELVRLFVKAGHEVQVVMTDGAKQFIQPLSFQALSGKPVRDSLFDQNQEAGMGHIELARWPDVIVIAPCSANSLAALRLGAADDLLSTLCLATDKPIILAPAMNRLMWRHAAVQENLAVLELRGIEIMPPAAGEQACGEVGEGRLPEAVEIAEFVLNFMRKKTENHQAWLSLSDFWRGKRLLITAGPTFEDLDPVRFIGNRSSGKMGFAIAEQAAQLGAEVTLISGPVHLTTPKGVERINVRSAEQMFAEVQKSYRTTDVFIAAAAVADFRPESQAEQKLKKTSDADEMHIRLVKNPDIVAWVASQADKPFVVGFAAETQNVIAYAEGKLKSKNLDLICANQVGQEMGFEQDQNALTLISRTRQKALDASLKSQQAFELLMEIEALWRDKTDGKENGSESF